MLFCFYTIEPRSSKSTHFWDIIERTYLAGSNMAENELFIAYCVKLRSESTQFFDRLILKKNKQNNGLIYFLI